MEYKTLSSTPQATVARWLWRAVTLVVVALVAVWAMRSWLVLTFPYQVEYGEGPVLDWILTLLTGHWPYKPIQPAPWTFSVYTPGYLLVTAALTPLVEALSGSLWAAGRLISLLSAVALAGLTVLLVSHEDEQRAHYAGWLTAGLWLATPYLARWATFYRPDLFALLWSAFGILLVERARGRSHLFVLAALAFVAGVFTKQSFFAAPLAAVVYLSWRDRRGALTLVVTGGVTGAVLAAGLVLATDGAAISNLIVANANPFSWEALWRFEVAFVRTVPIILGLALLAFFRRRSLVGVWFVLALLVTISAGKAGAWENYFLEPLFAGLVLAGRIIADAQIAPWLRRTLPALMLLQLALYVPGFERLSPIAEQRWLADLADEERALAAAIDAVPDPVLSEQMGAPAQLRRPVWLHSFVYTQLEAQGVFEPAPLLAAIRGHEFPLVVERAGARVDRLDLDRWSQTMLNAIEAAYAPTDRAGRWLLMQPFAPARAGNGTLDDTIRLARWDVAVDDMQAPAGPVALAPGSDIAVHLLWETTARPERDLTAYVHLVDWQGNRIIQSDAPPRAGTAPTSEWRTGDLIHDLHALTLPAAAEPGAYTLEVGMYADDGSGIVSAGPPIRLQGLKVPLANEPAPETAPLADVDGVLALLAIDVPQRVLPGDDIVIEVTWRAERAPARDLTAYLHLSGPCEDRACRLPPTVQDDHRPLQGRYPTNVWSAGEQVTTTHRVTVPADAQAGEYVLRLGWYDAGNGTPAPLTSEQYLVVDGALVVRLNID